MTKYILADLGKKLYERVRVHGKKEHILFSPITPGKNLCECSIEEILPHLLVCSSRATIESKENMWIATSMLVRFLASFTNNLVVMKSDIPVGILGSMEILRGLYENPSYDFFSEHFVHEIMNKNLNITSPKTRVLNLLKKMNQYKKDFALIQTTNESFSTISSRRLLEVGILCDTRIKVSDIPSKTIVTFQREDNLGTIIRKMLRSNSDILVLEHTPLFVTPQIIFEKISELNYLDGIDNFLDSKVSVLNLRSSRVISNNITIPEMCKIMLSMRDSFVMTQNNVLTPWDLIVTLA